MRSKHHIHVSYFDILRRRDRRKVGKKWRNVRRSFEVVTEKSPFSSQTQIITVSSIKLKIYHYHLIILRFSTRFYDLVIPELRVLYINITKNFSQRGISSRENLEKRKREKEKKRKDLSS